MTEGSGPLLEVADAHPLSDERAQALEGSRAAGGMGESWRLQPTQSQIHG